MEFSTQERVILSRLLRVEELLDPSVDYGTEIEALERGYEDFYPGFLDYFEAPISRDVTRFVSSVLDMYAWLQWAFTREDGSLPDRALCPGFDGNDRSGKPRSFAYAVYVVEKLGRWSTLRFSNDSINSHSFEPAYERMLSKFATLRDPYVPSAPTSADIAFAQEVLAAGESLGPANRDES